MLTMEGIQFISYSFGSYLGLEVFNHTSFNFEALVNNNTYKIIPNRLTTNLTKQTDTASWSYVINVPFLNNPIIYHNITPPYQRNQMQKYSELFIKGALPIMFGVGAFYSVIKLTSIFVEEGELYRPFIKINVSAKDLNMYVYSQFIIAYAISNKICNALKFMDFIVKDFEPQSIATKIIVKALLNTYRGTWSLLSSILIVEKILMPLILS